MSDPLATIAEDYELAVLRLIWSINRKNQERTLLCGAVELLPLEVPPPITGPERHVRVGGDHFVYASENVLPAAAGLAWFQQASRGRMIRPGKDGRIGEDGPDSPLFAASAFDEEPRAPLLATAARRVPFSAPWEAGARVRHLMPRTFHIDQLWSATDVDEAVAWIKADAHFDLGEFPEFWGSVHLIAPNPVFRRLRGRLDKSTDQLRLVVAVDLRGGQGIEGLHFELECKGATGTVYLLRRKFERPIERLELPGPPEEMYERVYDERRGLLYEIGPFMFSSEMSAAITVGIATEERRVSVQHADGKPADYAVPLVGGLTQTVTVGTPQTGRDAIIRLRSARNERDRRQRGRQDQRWFRDRAHDAVAELRKMVSGASELLWVSDPYFGGDDLLRTLLAVKDPKVPIQVLAGADHLRSRRNDGSEECDHLEQQIQEATGTSRMNPLTVHVMLGAPPPLHDRFLLIDDDLWLLGSSLNVFGDRGSMLLRVPDPEPVLEDLRRIWSQAQEFQLWLAERRSTRQR